jgi:UDP-3-O-[3-hydroxymyristoyl] glucosamine N-acyltransferase
MSGHPARPHREDLNRQAHLGRIEKLVERVKALEAEVGALKEATGPLDP